VVHPFRIAAARFRSRQSVVWQLMRPLHPDQVDQTCQMEQNPSESNNPHEAHVIAGHPSLEVLEYCRVSTNTTCTVLGTRSLASFFRCLLFRTKRQPNHQRHLVITWGNRITLTKNWTFLLFSSFASMRPMRNQEQYSP
jgi:hypothetical protein